MCTKLQEKVVREIMPDLFLNGDECYVFSKKRMQGNIVLNN